MERKSPSYESHWTTRRLWITRTQTAWCCRLRHALSVWINCVCWISHILDRITTLARCSCYRRSNVVCVCVSDCLSVSWSRVTTVNPAKLIRCRLWFGLGWAQGIVYFRWMKCILETPGEYDQCAAAMRPYVKLQWVTCGIYTSAHCDFLVLLRYKNTITYLRTYLHVLLTVFLLQYSRVGFL